MQASAALEARVAEAKPAIRSLALEDRAQSFLDEGPQRRLLARSDRLRLLEQRPREIERGLHIGTHISRYGQPQSRRIRRALAAVGSLPPEGLGMSRYELVSADSHVLEPPDLWTSYLPAKFHAKAPRVVP